MNDNPIIHSDPKLARFSDEIAPGLYQLRTMAGGSPDSPVSYPLGAPTVDGTLITVDQALNEPTRITRDIAQLAQQRFFMDRVFTSAGGISGGAILFERPNPLATDLYADRDVKEVAPGDEFPLMTFSRGIPMVARPRKIGGKWFVTKEARLRNDTSLLTRYMRQTANTLTRRIELMGLAELDAVTTAENRFTNGTSWSAYAATAPIDRIGTHGPVSDLVGVNTAVDLEERGHVLDSIILHPNEALSITQAFPNTDIGTILSNAGFSNHYVTPRQTPGRARLFEQGQVGEWRNEFPLEQETDVEGVAAGGRQRTWYQWSISPSFVIVDQFAMMEIRGIA